MQDTNPYAPPQADVAQQAPRTRKAGPFPWLLILRWLLGLGILGTGLMGGFILVDHWTSMSNDAIIDPMLSPYRYLPMVLFKIATGIALLMRTRWAVPLAVAWTVAFVGPSLVTLPWNQHNSGFFISLVEQLSTIALICLFWLRGLLR